jgi:calcineurin-like phosphoesterase family protein
LAALDCYFDFAVAEDEDSVFFFGDLQISLEEAKKERSKVKESGGRKWEILAKCVRTRKLKMNE